MPVRCAQLPLAALPRNLLAEKAERGEDPMGVIRDPARNRLIEFPREGPSGAVKFDAARMGGAAQATVHHTSTTGA